MTDTGLELGASDLGGTRFEGLAELLRLLGRQPRPPGGIDSQATSSWPNDHPGGNPRQA